MTRRLLVFTSVCLLFHCVAGSGIGRVRADVPSSQGAVPRRILVVSTSTRNRFADSINAAEKALIKMADESHAFTLDFAHQPTAPQPKEPKPPVALKAGATADEQEKFARAQSDFAAATAVYSESEKKFQDQMKQALQKLSPESLKNYDCVIFCYTSGDLPLPDYDGFLAWVKAGHAFIGLGNAMETMVSYPTYYDMLGGRWSHFRGDGSHNWTEIEILNQDSKHPANKGIPDKWIIKEFSWKVPNFVLSDPAHTHELIAIDKMPLTDQTPGHFPMAWCHDYGQGRVFYTALGGNLDLWDAGLTNRKNSPETARLFQTHLLGGIKWALGLEN